MENQIKKSFTKNVAFFLSAREIFFDNFKSKVFPIRNLDKTRKLDSRHKAMEKSKHKNSPLNNEIFKKYDGYQNFCKRFT